MENFKITAIGLMSGTSLDGLDACCATFTKTGGRWNFSIDAARGYDYTDEMKRLLGSEVQRMSAYDFVAFHSEYGKFLGERVADFIKEFGVKPDIVASHGHTVFHEPQKRIMCQIGDGAAIAAAARVPVVSDFRRLDIMLGGQGAPLVPIGDRLLFADYDYCLNIGGFSNISFECGGERLAFDISPANYVLNYYCRQHGLEFDRDGLIARSGKIDAQLLSQLDSLPFYAQTGAKSLGREWVEKEIYPLIDAAGLEFADILATFTEHAARQIANVVARYPKDNASLLITGGGALNVYMVERISELSKCRVEIPSRQIIEFKEALIFALLGALYMADEASCLSSVTGAACDNIGGMLFKI